MEPPHLKLVFLQGPREGETLGFEPNKVVRIGRIARNNTFSIKDAGISSNHLSIFVESSKWVLRDLDSSNGTLLNGSKIRPDTPLDLHHGDTIKIGELTSIQVDLQAQEGSRLRRNPRRQAKGKASSALPEKLEEESSETGAVLEPVEKKRGRPRKGLGLKSEVGEEFSKVQLQSIDENVEVGNELNVVPLQEKVEPPVKKPAARNSKKKRQQQSVIGTSDSSILTNSIDNSGLKCAEEKIVEKKTTRASTRRRRLQEETSLCDQVAISEDMVQEARDNTEANQNPGVKEGFEDDDSKKDCGGDKEACGNTREGEEACSSQTKDSNENGYWPDMEKLTLGEWFDFLEGHLPRQIIDETEEMIDSMKEKAERVRDYMAKQRNDEATLPRG